MADGIIKRFVRVLFDRPSAKKVEDELEGALQSAGKKGATGFLKELRQAFDKRMGELKVALSKGLISPAEFKKQGALAAKQFNAGVVNGMEAARKAGKLTDAEYIKLSKTLKKVGDEGSTAGSKLSGAFLRAGAALAGLFGARQIVGFFRESITEALSFEKSVARLDSVLRPLALTYRQVAGEVEGFLARIQETTRFSDDDAREAFTTLLVVTGDYRKSLQLLDTTARIAEFRQVSMAEAAQVAGDASKGLTRGMKDLGIQTGETGDLVAKIDTTLGNLATDALQNTEGRLANAKNLMADFKEEIGRAILGSDKLTDSLGPKGLRGALIALNAWAKEHSKDISGFVDKLVSAVEKIAKLSQLIMKLPQFRAGRAFWREVLGGDEAAEEQQEQTEAVRTGGTRRVELTKEELEERARLAREAAAERVRIEKANTQTITDLRERVQRTELALLTDHQREYEEITRDFWGRIQRLEGAALAEGIELLARAQENLLLKRSSILDGIDTRQAGVKQTEGPRPASLDPANLTAAPGADMAGFAERQAEFAKLMEDPWLGALGRIGDEVQGSMTLFDELGDAWAQSGVFGILKLAFTKIRENLAWAAEHVAKAAGALASGNAPAAALHAKAAAGHKTAAVLWGVAGAAGAGAKAAGLGGGGGASGGIEGGSPSLRGSQVEPVQAEVHIHFKGSGFRATNPEVQRIVFGAMEKARERYGNNVRVIQHNED